MTRTLKERLSSLDKAFLFLIGSISFAFSFLQALIGGMKVFILFSPLLIVGFIYPFYTGYLRGVVETGLIVERIRGWIYFTVGATPYFAMLSTVIFRDFRMISDLTLATYFAIILTGLYISHRLIRWLARVAGARLSESDLLLLGATTGSSFVLSNAAFFFQEYLRLWMSQPETSEPPYLIQALLVVELSAAFLLIERALLAVLSGRETAATPRVRGSKDPLGVIFDGTTVYLFSGLLSDAAGFWLAALSVALSILANLPYPQVQFWFRLSALSLMLLAMTRYARSRIRVIRTYEEVRSRMKEILHALDC